MNRNRSGIIQNKLQDKTVLLTSPYKMKRAVIIGHFRRGRTDVSMEITAGNIRSKLGYDPTNPDYIAVQACLDLDIVSVNVLRVPPKPEGTTSK